MKSYKHWNHESHKWLFNRTCEDAVSNNKLLEVTGDDLDNINLNNQKLKTGSKRISGMLKLAYYLGMLRGIRDADSIDDKIETRGDVK